MKRYFVVIGVTVLFVEMVIPSALLLGIYNEIITEAKISHKGRSYWAGSQNVFCENPEYVWGSLEKEYRNLEDMVNRYPKDAIYLHPVKLSKWIKK